MIRHASLRLHLVSLALLILAMVSLAAIGGAAPWFEAPYLTFSVGTRPTQLAAGDLDEDGATDLVVDGAVMLSRRDGTFRHRTLLPRTGFTALADMNGDGHLDAIVSGSPLSVYLGTGTGSFGPAIDKPGTYGRMVIADMNGDGRKDVFLVGAWMEGNGDGTLGAMHSGGAAPFGLEDDMAIGDVNHDGYTDIVAPNTRGLSMHPCWTMWPWLGAAFGAAQGFDVCGIGHPFHISAGDVDGDGFAEVRQDGMEIADLNGDGRNDAIDWISGTSVRVALNQGGGLLGGFTGSRVGNTYKDVAIGDFDADGRLDLAVATWGCDVLTQGRQCDPDYYPTTFTVLLGHGDGAFGAGEVVVPRSGVRWSALGDVDGDGRTDLVTAQSSNTISVLTGNGDATFDPPVDYPATNPSRVEIVDVDQDGRPDLVASGSSVVIHRGLGGGLFGDVHTVPGAGWSTFADFNGDGRLDLAINTTLQMGNGDGSFGPPVAYPTPSGSERNDAGDLDGDGDIDLVSSVSFDGIRILLNNGDGTLGASSLVYFTFNSMNRVVIADVTGDGRADILAAPRQLLGGAAIFGNVLLLRGTGGGAFAAPQLLEVGSSPTDLRVVDFDQDGKVDIVTSDDLSNSVSVLRGNGDGTFEEKMGFGSGAIPASVALGDVNGDAVPDLAVTSASGGVVTFFLHPPDQPTPTLLSLFEARAIDAAIEIRWRFAAGAGAGNVIVQRAPDAAGPWKSIEGAARRDGSTFTVVDGAVERGVRYWYRLSATGSDGRTSRFGPVSARLGAEAVNALFVAPNPGAGAVHVRFTLARAGAARVSVLDVQGRVVAVLDQGVRAAGEHVVDWRGHTAAGMASPGVYRIRLEHSNRIVERRLAWIR